MSVVVVMYSKYSSACNDLLRMIEPILDFRKLCVDHNEFRKVIARDDHKYQVKSVPCVIVFYSNGLLNKYEGDKAFEWAKEIIHKMKFLMSSESKEVNTSSFSQRSPIQFPEAETRHPPKPFFELPSKPLAVERVEPMSTPHVTNDELNETSDVPDMRRKMDSSPLIRDPVKRREQEEPQKQVDNREDTPNHNVRAIKSDKQESLLTLAQQMQKERDQEDDVHHPNPKLHS